MGIDADRAITPDLMTVDLDGKCKTLLQGWTAIGAASFTPDGDRVVFVGRPTDGKPIGAKSDLYLLDLATLEVECRTAALKVGVGGHLSMDMPVAGISAANTAVSADGALPIPRAGRWRQSYLLRRAGWRRRLPTADQWRLRNLSAEPGGWQAALRPHRAERAARSVDRRLRQRRRSAADGTQRRASAQINLPETEHLLWPSDDGIQVEGWYMKPAIGSAPYPTILYIHGGPHAAYGCAFHFDFQMWPAPDTGCYSSTTAHQPAMATNSPPRSKAIGATSITRI